MSCHTSPTTFKTKACSDHIAQKKGAVDVESGNVPPTSNDRGNAKSEMSMAMKYHGKLIGSPCRAIYSSLEDSGFY
jgi:hypothetical protein